MSILLHPTYFPSIAHFVAIINSKQVTFEICDNYQKQTYRNRMFIAGPNGKLPLSVPVIYSQNNRPLYKEIEISNATNWQDLHWKSIQSGYSSSPFFEFYEDDLKPLFELETTHLMDFNFKCFEIILECLQLDIKYNTTTHYNKDYKDLKDYRYLVDNRKEIAQPFEPYIQVFNEKYPFLINLSILDLICNEGPNAVIYLENQELL